MNLTEGEMFMPKRSFLFILAIVVVLAGAGRLAVARGGGACRSTGEMPCEDHVWYQELMCNGPGGVGHVRYVAVGCC